MADNVKILEPTGSAPTGYEQTNTAAKQIGGANGPKVQRVVPTFEATGGTQTDVTDATPMPVAAVALGTPDDVTATNLTGAKSAISLLKALVAWTLSPLTALKPSEEHIGQVGGDTLVVSAPFTRPADTTAYSLGDIVANSTTAGSVVPLVFAAARKVGGTGRISRVRITRSKPEVGNFRVHLFRGLPTVTSGDNAAMASSGAADYLGAFDVSTDRIFSDGAKGFGATINGSYVAFSTGSTTNLWALVEARSAVVPASGETITVSLEVDRD